MSDDRHRVSLRRLWFHVRPLLIGAAIGTVLGLGIYYVITRWP